MAKKSGRPKGKKSKKNKSGLRRGRPVSLPGLKKKRNAAKKRWKKWLRRSKDFKALYLELKAKYIATKKGSKKSSNNDDD